MPALGAAATTGVKADVLFPAKQNSFIVTEEELNRAFENRELDVSPAQIALRQRAACGFCGFGALDAPCAGHCNARPVCGFCEDAWID
jgi:hypothetical protein